MSDLFSVHIKAICGEDADVPRYYDLMHQKAQPQSRETSDQIIARFDALRRK